MNTSDGRLNTTAASVDPITLLMSSPRMSSVSISPDASDIVHNVPPTKKVTPPKPLLYLVAALGLVSMTCLGTLAVLSQPETTSTQIPRMTTEGRMIDAYSRNDEAIFTALAVTQAFRLNYLETDVQMENARPNFSPEGFINLRQSLTDNAILQTVITNRAILSAIPLASAIEISRGREATTGRKVSEFQIPILLDLQLANEKTTRNILVNVKLISDSMDSRRMVIDRMTIQ